MNLLSDYQVRYKISRSLDLIQSNFGEHVDLLRLIVNIFKISCEVLNNKILNTFLKKFWLKV